MPIPNARDKMQTILAATLLNPKRTESVHLNPNPRVSRQVFPNSKTFLPYPIPVKCNAPGKTRQ